MNENKFNTLPQEQAQAEEFSLNDLVGFVGTIKQELAPTGALDSEFGHIDSYLTQAQEGKITPAEARDKISGIVGDRNDYH